jgi:hypothetical protein
VTQKWNVLGEIGVGIFALRDITEDEELTFDYQFDVYHTPFTRCLCGTKKCKGYLGLVPLEYTAEEWEQKIENLPCSICGVNVEGDDDLLLLCDGCNNGFHTFCLTPPLLQIPHGAWFCDTCKHQDAGYQAENNPDAMAIENPEVEPINVEYTVPKKVLINRHAKVDFSSSGSESGEEGSDSEERDHAKDYDERYEFERALQRDLYKDEKKKKRRKVVRVKKAVMPTAAGVEPESSSSSEDADADNQFSPTKILKREARERRKSSGIFPEEKVVVETGGVPIGGLKERKRKRDNVEDIKNCALIFQEIWVESEEYKSLKDIKIVEFINNVDEKQDKKTILLSPLATCLYRDVVSRACAIKLTARVYWNNVNRFSANIYLKTNEFSIIGNAEQGKFLDKILALMEKAIEQYKQINGYVKALIEVPAIYLKRVIGDYHKNLHFVEKEFQVKMHYDKRYITDECYPINIMTFVTLAGNMNNITKAHQHLQNIVNDLFVYRTYMSNNEIRIIIANLMNIKTQIHPTEIRCCRDNALRDINHPFYTIYYKDKEVALVGTKKEVDNAEVVVTKVINANKSVMKNQISLNYLIPVCNKSNLIKIKNELESENPGCKMIIYDPLHPRKNVSLTLVSNYTDFPKVYETMKHKLDKSKLYEGKFENYQNQTAYQMTKYFFKYMQNYFQTFSPIFMKAWDTVSADFDDKCNDYNSTFNMIKDLYITDHE